MPPRDALIQHMLDELEILGRGLTPWESQFLEDAVDCWSRERRLTAGQFAKLQELYERRV
jgi:hypothetical protein